MYYHIQINYFNSDSGDMTLLSECNIRDLDDLKEKVIKPYVFGHSFTFGGLGLILASIHSFSVYASELPIHDVGEEGVKEVTREVMEGVKI